MKKTTIALACAALLLLPGASTWEGSAVVAGSGELPESGYYIATNSFPRNTIVDVKNLETDKSVRAIVAGGLDSPGLLASLSAEAASAIGLSRRTVGRIRVTMPADPIAFSRFTDGLATSSDPDRNPRAAAGSAAAPDAAAAAAGPVAVAAEAAGSAAPVAVAAAVPPAAPAGPIVKEEAVKKPEAAPKTERIIDVPENYVPPTPEAAPAAVAVVPAGEDKPEAAPEKQQPETSAPTPTLAAAEKAKAELVEEPALVVSETPQTNGATAAPIAPEPAVTVVAEPETRAEAVVEPTPPVPTPPEGAELVLDLKPAEERPPKAPETKISEEAIVGPPAAVAAETKEPAEPELSPELFLAPLPSAPPVAAAPSEQAPSPASAAPAQPDTRPAAKISAPGIEKLEKGKYYVQLGAFADTAAVDEAVAKLAGTFPAAVETSGKPEKPVYRVYVGPVNQGESGALLLRFKRGGYPDAFVKKGN